jgi:hypothetical protein
MLQSAIALAGSSQQFSLTKIRLRRRRQRDLNCASDVASMAASPAIARRADGHAIHSTPLARAAVVPAANSGRARRRPASNRLVRTDRIKRWNDAVEEGKRNDGTKIEGESARWIWLQCIVRSNLAQVARHIAHALSLHGRDDGSEIWPSTRCLMRECNLSDRAVSTHLDGLVRAGYLMRAPRRPDAKAGAQGFRYVLFAPKSVLREVENARSKPAGRGAPGLRAEPRSAR